ncbi:NUDIX hydrolase [Algoriphagus sp. NG3]|uniref:NUDIX hydrolase n=1 Tax=Algoriphagus sp. NG3 TaxID=3097546 RepID=UPI002A80EC30|nr:NUDIX hydrolase [Algoriphagus sp. NG3]WPR77605.1 NUDIX hydrolase [Algoriphagus sp. NG3]
MEQNPWTTKKINPVYENPWIKVEHHEIINPAGNEGVYGKVHFKNRAMGIIPIDKDMNTWLIGQYRYTLEEYAWEIPMGGGPLEEDKLESAQRELREETGLTAGKWTEMMTIHTSNSVTDEVGFVYLAEELSEGEPEFDETEVLKVRKLPFVGALEMVMNGEITDAISIAGILKASRILKL